MIVINGCLSCLHTLLARRQNSSNGRLNLLYGYSPGLFLGEVLPRVGVTMMLVYKSLCDEDGLCQWSLVSVMILAKWWSSHHHHPLDIISWCPHGHNDGSQCWTQVTGNNNMEIFQRQYNMS